MSELEVEAMHYFLQKCIAEFEKSNNPVYKNILIQKIRKARQLLRDQEKNHNLKEYIIDSVCNHFNIDSDQILKKVKAPKYVKPRQFAMYFLKKETDLILKEIGNIFDKDYATVWASINAIQNLIDTNDKEYKPYYLKIYGDILRYHSTDRRVKIFMQSETISKHKVVQPELN